ncbi:MAG: autotransporter outer membrane beta-barrel domain-containing protein, partial [Thermodesulfobacteriota bacterium]
LTHQGNQVLATINRKPFADLAGNENQAGPARGLDSLVPSAGGDMGDLIWGLDQMTSLSEMRRSFEAMSPQRYDAFTETGLNQGVIFQEDIARRLGYVRLGVAPSGKEAGLATAMAMALTKAGDAGIPTIKTAGPWSFWTRGYGNWTSAQKTDQYGGFDASIFGMSLGADRTFGGWLTLGACLGLSRALINWDPSAGDGRNQGLNLGLYAGLTRGGLYLDASGSYGYFDYSSDRRIQYSGVDRTAHAESSANRWGAYLGGGYDFRWRGLVFGPTASAQYQHLYEAGFTETGAGSLNLSVDERRTDSCQVSLGGRVARVWETGGTNPLKFVPQARLRWVHEFNNDPRFILARFSGSDTFRVPGLAVKADTAAAGLGLSLFMSEAVSLYLDAEAALFRADYSSFSLAGGVRVRF